MISIYTILFFVAVALLPLAWLLNAVVVIWLEKQLSWRQYYKTSAVKIDITANEFFPAMWRKLFSRTGNTDRFGNSGETLSYALAKLQQDDDLSRFANVITWLIHVLDREHYEREIEFYELKTNK